MNCRMIDKTKDQAGDLNLVSRNSLSLKGKTKDLKGENHQKCKRPGGYTRRPII